MAINRLVGNDGVGIAVPYQQWPSRSRLGGDRHDGVEPELPKGGDVPVQRCGLSRTNLRRRRYCG